MKHLIHLLSLLALFLSALVSLAKPDNFIPTQGNLAPTNALPSKLTVYPALPNNQYRSDRYKVTVYQSGRGLDSYVYSDPNNDLRYPSDRAFMTLDNHFTTFSFSGQILLQIKLPSRHTEISSVEIRPLSKHLKATISGNTISIPLAEPANFYVEIDGEQRHPLFIFANPPEVNVPAPNDTNVIYFGPGIHDIGIKDNPAQNIAVGKSVYLAGGAYVKGVLMTTGGTGTTTVRGRGILSGINITGHSGIRATLMPSGEASTSRGSFWLIRHKATKGSLPTGMLRCSTM